MTPAEALKDLLICPPQSEHYSKAREFLASVKFVDKLTLDNINFFLKNKVSNPISLQNPDNLPNLLSSEDLDRLPNLFKTVSHDPSLMILSAFIKNGYKPPRKPDVSEEVKESESHVLVIGDVLSGKSTLINYLLGVQFEWDDDYGERLSVKPNQSQTGPVMHHVYGAKGNPPEKFKCGQLTLVDCPGVGEEKNDNAIKQFVANNSNIKAIVITIPFNNFEQVARSHDALWLFMLKLVKLFNFEKIQEKNAPAIIFAITKPPEPRRGHFFNPDDLRWEIVEDLIPHCSNVNAATNFNQLIRSEQLLDQYLKLVKDFSQPFAESLLINLRSIKTIVNDIRSLSRALEIKSDYEDIYFPGDDEENPEKYKDNISEIIKARNLNNLSKQVSAIILVLKLIQDQNLYILRCFKNDSNDHDDHRESLLNHLQRLCEQPYQITSEFFSTPLEQVDEVNKEVKLEKSNKQVAGTESYLASWASYFWPTSVPDKVDHDAGPILRPK